MSSSLNSNLMIYEKVHSFCRIHEFTTFHNYNEVREKFLVDAVFNGTKTTTYVTEIFICSRILHKFKMFWVDLYKNKSNHGHRGGIH